MKYSELINFEPIDSLIVLTHASDKTESEKRVKNYVLSDSMASQIKHNMLSQLNLDDVVDNKGVLLVGNYGTGKSHLMSVISAIALDEGNLEHLRNRSFAEDAKTIAGRFEVLRIEIGAVTTPLREIIFSKVKEDFAARGLNFDYPSADAVANNKETLNQMMGIFGSKYPDRGYLILVDEFLDFLRGKDDYAVRLDLGFMRELGELVKESRLRVIFGVQEKLFDDPRFSFIAETINRVRDRFEQVIIRKEDTAYVVSERILKKTDGQKAYIRSHLQKFSSLYANMSERIDEYVSLYPIHPAFIDVFNKIYVLENRQILKNISELIKRILDSEINEDIPGVLSFDSYWNFIRENFSYRADANIKEVVEKSAQLEDIINRSYPKKLYKPLALQIIHALSVHRLTTGDIQIRAGLTSQNLRDDLCLFIQGLPDQSSDTLQTLVQAVLKDVMTTVSGQFIDYDAANGQYYLDVKKDVDYDEKITQRAATLTDDSLNQYFYEIVYFCLEWDAREYVPGFRIYEHTLNWDSHRIFRKGYLFMGKPKDRSTAEPPEDYYLYFLPPYGDVEYEDHKKSDEVFFIFKPNEDFKNNLRLYAAANILRSLAEEKNKSAYSHKSDIFRKKLTAFLSEHKKTCFDVVSCGIKKRLFEAMKGRFRPDTPFKETIDLAASLLLEPWFQERYPEYPVFKTGITLRNQAEAIRRAFDRFGGKKEQLGNAMLDSFGLLSGDQISIKDSKYANYYAKRIESLGAGVVLNFNDIYEPTFDGFVDRQFGISYAMLPIVFLGLAHAGIANMTLKDGTTISASNLETVPKINVLDIYEFKHISKPKDMPMAELTRLCKVFDLPEGLIRNAGSRANGLVQILAKAQEFVSAAIKAKTRLDAGESGAGDFALWGEPLIPSHIAQSCKQAATRVQTMLGNFHVRFNTVAKLNNFTYTKSDLDALEADIKTVKIVLEHDTFRTEASAIVSYMMNIEPTDIGYTLKKQLEDAKNSFRDIRQSIADGKFGETAAMEVNRALGFVKEEYIDLYFNEHKKSRLDIKDGSRRGKLLSSNMYANLKRLAELEIFSKERLAAIAQKLAVLKVCTDLTPEILRTVHYCQKCNFQLGGAERAVTGAMERLEDEVELLTEEWKATLHITLTDSMVSHEKQYLKPEQQEVIDKFIDSKALPERVDGFFIEAVKTLLAGFDTVVIGTVDLSYTMSSFGPCDLDTFRAKMDAVLEEHMRGKDKSKLRIIVRMDGPLILREGETVVEGEIIAKGESEVNSSERT